MCEVKQLSCYNKKAECISARVVSERTQVRAEKRTVIDRERERKT